MEASAVRGRFLDRKRRRNARLDDRYRLGSAFASKGASLDPFSYSMSHTASNTPQPSIIQRAMFTCNATPIAHLPVYFSTNRFFDIQLAGEIWANLRLCAASTHDDFAATAMLREGVASSMTFLSEPHRPPRDLVHGADHGARNHLEFARSLIAG